MTHLTYSPDESVASDSSEQTIDDLQSAYDRRAKVQVKQKIAVNLWRKKVLFSACLLIITSGFLLFSEIWYANVVGIAGAFLGIYGAFKKNTEFIFVYMVLLALEFIKNVGIFIYYATDKVNIELVLLLTVCCIEELFILPLSMYYAFKLYHSVNLENDDIETVTY